ncbi:MAG TPA: hypothetical protein VH560_03110 [Polyangia bacterium]|jgi:hypothetical protein|nr:hypothetical protein [Polyangia bacterium]
MRTTTLLLSLSIIFVAANGCGSSSGGSPGTAGAKGSAGASGAAGSGSAGATGTAGADGGSAGSGSAGAGDAGTAGAGDAGTAGAGTAGAGAAGAGGSTDGGGDASDGSAATCGTSTEANIGPTCNTADATGPCVIPTVGTGAAPTPAGGPITGGTYDLTAFTVYPTADASVQADGQPPRRATLVIPATTTGTFSIQLTQSTGATTERQAGSVMVTGSEVMFTPTCPPPGDGGDNGGTAGFTATTTTFTLFEVGGNGAIQVNLYTKR